MASSLPSFRSLTKPFHYHKIRRYLQVRSQSFRDEGKGANMVDSNLSVLRERIEAVRRQETLDKGSLRLENGWRYNRCGYDEKRKRHAMLLEFMEVVSLATTSLGLVFLIGSLCIFLVSLAVHFQIETCGVLLCELASQGKTFVQT
ncbi:hypothetical protein RJ639_029275 [Escallonia herrerae]|uniref:Uncharacterized protein n=1 Tax=Escallonia herrerae TaxID=1293975 RepID=A0AA89BH21_9ASTE|nr:hypothetical protein RJ639_029275 [Escallonia herrerae]